MITIQNATVEQLRKLVSIKEHIETLQREIIAGTKARWAKIRAAKGEITSKKKGK